MRTEICGRIIKFHVRKKLNSLHIREGLMWFQPLKCVAGGFMLMHNIYWIYSYFMILKFNVRLRNIVKIIFRRCLWEVLTGWALRVRIGINRLNLDCGLNWILYWKVCIFNENLFFLIPKDMNFVVKWWRFLTSQLQFQYSLINSENKYKVNHKTQFQVRWKFRVFPFYT